MKKTHFRVLVVVFASFVLGILPLWSQTKALGARIVYSDDDSQVSARGPDGKALPSTIGTLLAVGSSVSTRASSLELELVPNGSAIRIAPNTTFRIDTLEGDGSGAVNAFSLISGKIRMVAAKEHKSTASYLISTPTAVAGVRGTDFGREYQGGEDWLCVLEGNVDFSSPDGSASVNVATGAFVNVNAGFVATRASPEWIANNFNDIQNFAKAKRPDR